MNKWWPKGIGKSLNGYAMQEHDGNLESIKKIDEKEIWIKEEKGITFIKEINKKGVICIKRRGKWNIWWHMLKLIFKINLGCMHWNAYRKHFAWVKKVKLWSNVQIQFHKQRNIHYTERKRSYQQIAKTFSKDWTLSAYDILHHHS